MWWKPPLCALAWLMLMEGVCCAAPMSYPTFVDATTAGPDLAVQGEYQGWRLADDKHDKHAPSGAQVIAQGDGKYSVVLYQGGLPGAGWDRSKKKETFPAETKDGIVSMVGSNWRGVLAAGELRLTDSTGRATGDFKRVERRSPTLKAPPAAGAIVLLDGVGLDKFQGGGHASPEGWLVMGPAEPGGKRGEAVSKETFGSFVMHLEFRTPFMPTAKGQARGNSGVYLDNRYECQVLDSFGLEGEDNECGGFYKAKRPDVNMCFPPLSWQTYDIEFTAPRFDKAGKKVKNARVTVRHNGVVIHHDVELPHVTPGGLSTEGPTGALKLQDHGNPVAYRNIWIVTKE
ncbi:MAG TPA: DUF1080 domain-containing protein [Pirellulales bacterium]|jgi:hypothetical protein|nr:DUF1080 domain-containing protein [Pirellulales bacterium]